MRTIFFGALWLMFFVAACGDADRTDGTTQYPDDSFTVPDGKSPRFQEKQGPVVSIDETHHNYHTVDDKYRSFANLLRDDGYQLGGFTNLFTAESLARTDVLVISNALSAENEFEWSLPTPSAFSDEEVDAVEEWVTTGGRLMLIADHMPFPGAAAKLAIRFGIIFHDGFAYRPESWDNQESQLVFSKENGLLTDPGVTRLDGGGEIPFVVTFTGQGFRILPGTVATPLLALADDSFILLPQKAYDFDESAPQIPGIGLLQGALVNHGEGRVAVFGEAAMFSAQIQEREAGPYPFGMNNPSAPHHARFLLNVVGWLTSTE